MQENTAVGTRVMFETDSVRVWDLVVEAESATDWHRHLCPYIYIVIEPGKVRTDYQNGSGEDQDDDVGQVVLRDDTEPHRLVNLGKKRYRNIVIELKTETLSDGS